MGIFGEELFFQLFNNNFEGFVIFTRTFLYPHNDVAIHLEKAAIAVIGKALIFAALGQSANGAIIEAEVENGVHHSGHRVASARAHCHQERIFLIAKLFSHGGFEFVDRFVDLLLECGWVGPFMVVVVGANFCADGETGRYGQADAGHFRQIGPFSTQKRLHLAISVRLSISKGVNVLRRLAGALFGFRGFRFCWHE